MSKETEKKYFDFAYEFEVRKPVSKFCSIIQYSKKYYEDLLLANCDNKKVLEYGCGRGTYAYFLSRHRAEVTGIDISEVAIESAKRRAQEEGLENTVFLLMDAEAMQFEDSSFDVISGRAVLHHIQLPEAMKEIARVLKPEGKAIFIEPMGYNPAINLCRRLTPSLRTKDEKPLTAKDLKLISRFFCQANYSFFNLFTLLAVPFRNKGVFPALLEALEKFDRKLFEMIPAMRYLCWQVVIVLEKPKKAQ